MTTVDELCKILKAHEKGESIQVLSAGKWIDVTSLNNWSIYNLKNQSLRIKPEPREIWILESEVAAADSCLTNVFLDEYRGNMNTPKGEKLIKFREVLEDE